MTEKEISKLNEAKEANLRATQTYNIEEDPSMQDNRYSHMYDDLISPEAVDKYSYDNMDYDGENDMYNS